MSERELRWPTSLRRKRYQPIWLVGAKRHCFVQMSTMIPREDGELSAIDSIHRHPLSGT